ncbi:MAG: hypothetical protein RI973_2183 [Bacteroidota bacterium]|jgi:hypothetical protein
MNTLRYAALTAIVTLSLHLNANAQLISGDTYALVNTFPKEKSSTPGAPLRNQKKLPQLFCGYAIEIAYAEYPLDPADPIFRQFGNVVYQKLQAGGYSYLILGRFSTREGALQFMKTVMLPRVEDARLFEYTDGHRTVIREG